MKYKIYSGLGGGYGGAFYTCHEEHDTLESAEQSAYYHACDDYEAYGLAEQVIESLKEDEDFWELTDDEIEQYIQDDRENWIDYYVEEV